MARLELAANASANGSAMQWPGGQGILMAEGTFGGGTVKLQCQSSPQGTWLDVDGATLSAAGTKLFYLGACPVRINIATATAVYASVSTIGR